jgi:hypothetical protein
LPAPSSVRTAMAAATKTLTANTGSLRTCSLLG